MKAKKWLAALLCICAAGALSSACDVAENFLNGNGSSIGGNFDSSTENVLDNSSENGLQAPSTTSSTTDSSDDQTGATSSDGNENGNNSESGGQNSSDGSQPPETSGYTYVDFTAAEKQLFTQYIGEVIPFAPNDEYYVEGYYDVDDYENGMAFYTFGNTQADFNAYRQKFIAAQYTLTDTYEDDYGDTWYCYEKNDIVVDVSYYYYDGEYVIDLYVYSSLSSDIGGDTGDTGDNSGDNGGGVVDSDIELIINAGKGLPKANGTQSGVYNVDFTHATAVKDVTDQGYYLDGCPTVSTATQDPAVLVIPVEFSDVTAASKGYTTQTIEKAFNGGVGDTDYYSVHDYYYTSSYGKLDLDITVLDTWFRPSKTSAYYAKQTQTDDYGDEILIGDQMVMDEALAALSKTMDLSKFDSDGNAVIDAVVLITTLTIDENADFYWAFRYWNMYTDDEGYYYEYDGVSANDYLWAPYQFLHESYDANGDVSYTDTTAMNTYTFIHEFGHVLGADDYYDTSYSGNSPLDGCDIMDGMTGDHNPYTKFNYGWLKTSRLIVAEESVTLTLEDFSENGDTIIIANNWDETLGAYQEYYVLIYYTDNGLNGGGHGYFSRNGVLVYHVNASLYKEVWDGETYYDVYNNNTSASDESGYGTEDNLIELVPSSAGNYTYVQGDGIPSDTTDDQGNKICYTFTVLSLTDGTATVQFTKNA